MAPPSSQSNLSGIDPGTFPVYIKNITLYNRGGKLKIDLEFSLKQFFPNNTSAAALEAARESLFNKLKVLVVVTSDTKVAHDIFMMRSKIKGFLNPGISSIYDSSKVVRGTYDFLDAVRAPLTQSQQFGSMHGSDLIFRKTFELPSNPAYLGIFAAPIVDTNEDNDSSVIRASDVTVGKIASELVIKNSKTNLESTLFYHQAVPGTSDGEDGRIWVGEVHQDSLGKWRTGDGSSGANSGQKLRTQKVISSKINDQRTIGRLQRLSFDFNKLNTLSARNKKIRDRLKVKEKIKEKPSYLSPLYSAKSYNNDLNLYFGFDYLEAIVNGAKYQALYGSVQDKLSACTVKSTRVIRRRINKSGTVYSRLFDKKIEVVGTPQQMDLNSSTGVLQYVIADKLIRGKTTGLYEYGFEITIEDHSRDRLLNILTGVDPGSPGVDLIVARLQEFLRRSLLPKNYNILTNRYTPSFIEEIKNGDAFREQYFASGVHGGSILSESTPIERTYEIEDLSRLYSENPEFTTGPPDIHGVTAESTVTVIPAAPWTRGAGIYAFVMGYIFDDPLSTQEVTNLMIATNPLVTGPAGIEQLIRLLRDFSSSLRNALGVTKGSKTSMAQAPGAPTTGGKKLFTIRQFFSETVDADKLHDYGLDVLSLVPPQQYPDRPLFFKRLNFTSWQQLVDNQVGKDNGIASDSAIFLTPNFLKLPGRPPLSIYGGPAVQNAITEGLYELLYANMYRNSPIILSRRRTPRTNNRSLQRTNRATVQNKNAIMHFNSCVATVFQRTPQNPIFNIFPTPPTTEDLGAEDVYKKGLDVGAVMSTTSKFISDYELDIANEALSGSAAISLLQNNADGSTSDVATQLVANMSSISSYLTQGDFFNGKPNPQTPGLITISGDTFLRGEESVGAAQEQAAANSDELLGQQALPLDAPALGNPAAAPEPPTAPSDQALLDQAAEGELDPANIALIAAKHGFVYIVEYMASYLLGGVGVVVTEPVWNPLTATIVANAQANNRSLVCRLKRHQTSLANFNGLKIPLYDEIFILGRSGASLELPDPVAHPGVPTYSLPTGLVENIDAFSDSIEFANSYDSDTRVSERVIRTAGEIAQARQSAAAAAARRAAEAREAAAKRAEGAAAARAGSDPVGAPAPPTLTLAQRSRRYRDFYDWYMAKGPSGRRRFQTGNSTGRPWPPPRQGNSKLDRAVRTLKMLRFGYIYHSAQRNIITLYENQTGKIIPPRVFDKNDGADQWRDMDY